MKKSSLKLLFAASVVAVGIGISSTAKAMIVPEAMTGNYNRIWEVGTNNFVFDTSLLQTEKLSDGSYGVKGFLPGVLQKYGLTSKGVGGSALGQTFYLTGKNGQNWSNTIWNPNYLKDVYRLYNPNSGEHFYTYNAYEAWSLKSIGWQFEGYAWESPTVQSFENIKSFAHFSTVYRVYNPNSGEHFYTTSNAEAASLARAGWHREGTSFNAGGTTAVYRLYNPNATGAGAHFYTMNAGERNSLKAAGWHYEGISWYTTKG